MTTANEQQTDGSGGVAAGGTAMPALVAVLAAGAAVCMGTQIRFPWLGGRVGLADAALGLAFLAFLWDQFRRRVIYHYPALLALALALCVAASILARAGSDAATECVQRFEQLFCGFLIWAALLRERRPWVAPLITLMLALNVLAAALQARAYGYGSVLPPADIMALPWGIGKAFSGLFRSRVSLSLFLGGGLLLVQPFWHDWAGTSIWRRLAVMVGMVMVLVMIPHGFILLACALALLAAGLLRGGGNGWRNGVALLAAVVVLMGTGRMALVRGTLSPVQPGTAELKSCHVDFLAALRMAALRPWTGVGMGTYQKYIGRCYGELPNPNVNDVETDTQAGLGILLGTTGYPAALVLLLAMLLGLLRAVERFALSARADRWALAGASALGFFLLALLVSDPFVRGPAWFLTLALAAAAGAGADSRPGTLPLGWGRTVLAGILAAAGAAILVVVPKADALARHPVESRPRTPRAAALSPVEPAATPTAVQPATAGSSTDFFRVLNAAADAKVVTPPMERGPDSQSAKGTILRIPDKKGVPPEGQDPDMKHGGASYELTVNTPVTCKIWVRAWWEGSCGNTVCIRLGEKGKPLTVGNDGTYDSWHWLEAPGEFTLDKGTHTLYLLNREDGVRFDQILVTNDMEYYPQGVEEE